MSNIKYTTTVKTSARESVKLNGKTIGWVEDGVFHKPVLGSKHMLRYPKAWAIDAQVFDEQIKPHCREIRISDRETGMSYRASVDVFCEHCFWFNRGFGDQYALSLEYWEGDASYE